MAQEAVSCASEYHIFSRKSSGEVLLEFSIGATLGCRILARSVRIHATIRKL